MRYFIRVFLFNVFSLWFTSEIFPALRIDGDWRIILFAGLVLSVLMVFIKPLLKILFIPVNLLTFGLLSWLINVIILYTLTVLVPEVRVVPWTFPGADIGGFIAPKIHVAYIPALILSSLSVTALSHVLHDISEN